MSALAHSESLEQLLAGLRAEQRVEYALKHLRGAHALSSSFGAQSAVMLHLVNQVAPGIPVILTDTGHLFPETYRFIDELSDRLKLNLKIYRAALSPAWQEARYGRLWEQGLPGIERCIEHRAALGRDLELMLPAIHDHLHLGDAGE